MADNSTCYVPPTQGVLGQHFPVLILPTECLDGSCDGYFQGPYREPNLPNRTYSRMEGPSTPKCKGNFGRPDRLPRKIRI